MKYNERNVIVSLGFIGLCSVAPAFFISSPPHFSPYNASCYNNSAPIDITINVTNLKMSLFDTDNNFYFPYWCDYPYNTDVSHSNPYDLIDGKFEYPDYWHQPNAPNRGTAPHYGLDVTFSNFCDPGVSLVSSKGLVACADGELLWAGNIGIVGAEIPVVGPPVPDDGGGTAFGKTVFIYYPSMNVTFMYAHLHELPPLGIEIHERTPIGIAGHTGSARGWNPHVHITVIKGRCDRNIWKNIHSKGKKTSDTIDPYPYLYGKYYDAYFELWFRERAGVGDTYVELWFNDPEVFNTAAWIDDPHNTFALIHTYEWEPIESNWLYEIGVTLYHRNTPWSYWPVASKWGDVLIFPGCDAFEKKLAELDTSKTNLPKDYALSPPRPNPFNTAVSFEVDLPRTSIVELKIYDILGRLVDVPIEGTEIPAGRFTETWRCESCPSGTYFAVLLTNNFHQTRKMMLVK